jgi:orotidine-5'-phosphate decarboxylase
MADVHLYCALDSRERAGVEALARELAPAVDGIKLGLEYFCANGPEGIAAVTAIGRPLFLDLKLHDIPNTVAGAVRSVAALEPRYLTIHAAGGLAMMRAAREAAEEAAGRRSVSPIRLLAVTVLTSLGLDDLARQGIAAAPHDQVLRLAALAREAGCAGVIASPLEVEALRAEHGSGFEIVVPGIRPSGADQGDQKRVMTPADAARAGATALVVGRPITQAPDPAAAARGIQDEIASVS